MKGRENPHILTLSPPIRLESQWLKPTAYMMAKFGMTLCALGIAEEMRAVGIASNTLWPRTLVATAAVQNLLGGDEAMARARKPEGICRRCIRGAEPARPRIHRPFAAVRGRPAGVGDHRPVGLRLHPRFRAGCRPLGRRAQSPATAAEPAQIRVTVSRPARLAAYIATSARAIVVYTDSPGVARVAPMLSVARMV